MAQKFGVHRRMVREAIGNAVPKARKVAVREKPKTAAVILWIEEMLQADQTAPRKQRHTAHRIWRRLKVEHPEAEVAESTVHHYVFTDSTGAEYRLTSDGNGRWSSKDGVYVTFDANAQTLYFPDGSHWSMGATAAGTEDDAGTMYPTRMQDTNGNQIFVRYQSGTGTAWPDSSGRVTYIEDVRAQVFSDGTKWTYVVRWDYPYDPRRRFGDRDGQNVATSQNLSERGQREEYTLRVIEDASIPVQGYLLLGGVDVG